MTPARLRKLFWYGYFMYCTSSTGNALSFFAGSFALQALWCNVHARTADECLCLSIGLVLLVSPQRNCLLLLGVCMATLYPFMMPNAATGLQQGDITAMLTAHDIATDYVEEQLAEHEEALMERYAAYAQELEYEEAQKEDDVERYKRFLWEVDEGYDPREERQYDEDDDAAEEGEETQDDDDNEDTEKLQDEASSSVYAVDINDENLRVDMASLDEAHENLRQQVQAAGEVATLRTCGDGACSVHAVLGTPNDFRELYHADARDWIATWPHSINFLSLFICFSCEYCILICAL